MIATMNDIFSICVNLLGPEPNGWHSADNIFKFENVVCKISAIVFQASNYIYTVWMRMRKFTQCQIARSNLSCCEIAVIMTAMMAWTTDCLC